VGGEWEDVQSTLFTSVGKVTSQGGNVGEEVVVNLVCKVITHS
jgi:hypothetical protein